MRLQDLPAETRERLQKVRFDRMVEKHEGPWEWEWWLKEADFLDVDGRPVLLPVPAEDHENIRILRTVLSADEQILLVYLKDTTFYDDDFSTGFFAVCERYPGDSFYVAMIYHEWYPVPKLADAITAPSKPRKRYHAS